MICKITVKNVASPMHHLKDDNGTLITDSRAHTPKNEVFSSQYLMLPAERACSN